MDYLLPAMVCGIQHELRALRDAFCLDYQHKSKIASPSEGRNPRIELPYTYLIAWFAMHCPVLLKPGVASEDEDDTASLCNYERSKWTATHVAGARKLVRYRDNYTIFRCFPDMDDADYDQEFQDINDLRFPLTSGVMRWLMCIRPSHYMKLTLFI